MTDITIKEIPVAALKRLADAASATEEIWRCIRRHNRQQATLSTGQKRREQIAIALKSSLQRHENGFSLPGHRQHGTGTSPPVSGRPSVKFLASLQKDIKFMLYM